MKYTAFLGLILGLVCMTTSCDSKKNAGEAEAQDTTQTVSAGKYCNQTYGFCISYPNDLLSPSEGIEAEDGQIFKSEDGMAELRIYLDKRISPVEGEAINLQTIYDEDIAYKSGVDITYKTFATTSYTIMGLQAGQLIFYQKTIISNGKVVTAMLRYMGTEKATYDALIDPIFKSFK